MSDKSSTSSREKWIRGIKTGGNLLMYIGSAALANSASPREGAVMSACATGTSAMLSIGAGKMASGIFNKVVDKAVEFIDDINPKDDGKAQDTVNDKEV